MLLELKFPLHTDAVVLCTPAQQMWDKGETLLGLCMFHTTDKAISIKL